MTLRGPLALALALASCGVKAPPRPAASAGVESAPAGTPAPVPAPPASTPCDPASGGACGK
jgi:hypothetical protein